MTREAKIKLQELDRLIHDYKRFYIHFVKNGREFVRIGKKLLEELEDMYAHMELIETGEEDNGSGTKSNGKTNQAEGNDYRNLQEGNWETSRN